MKRVKSNASRRRFRDSFDKTLEGQQLYQMEISILGKNYSLIAQNTHFQLSDLSRDLLRKTAAKIHFVKKMSKLDFNVIIYHKSYYLKSFTSSS